MLRWLLRIWLVLLQLPTSRILGAHAFTFSAGQVVLLRISAERRPVELAAGGLLADSDR